MKNFLLQYKKTILIVVVAIIGAACLTKILLEYQWQTIFESLKTSNLSLFLVGSTLSIIFYWCFRALRWYVLLRNVKENAFPFWQIYLVTAVTVGISTITPFQSGEALKVEYLRKFGGQRLSGYAIFILERFLDLLAVVGLGILGVSAGFNFGIPQWYFYIFAFVLLVSFLTVIGFIFLFPSERLLPIKALIQEKWQQKWTLLLAAILTVLSWLAVVLGWKNALASVSINIDFLQATSLVSLTTLLAIMSFVPGAVGVSEVSITAILGKMGVVTTLAQTGAIAVRAYALMILVLTLLHWLALKLFSSKINQNNLIKNAEVLK